jgi:predicted pyridoxine 5'-phosphate oxidase superfamily flavin-nucleotide-binding protein
MNQATTGSRGQVSPYHPGERHVQQLVGVREEAETRGRRMLTADINSQQVQFFSQLPFLVSSHTDASGQPWAGLLTGEPGFVSVEPASQALRLDWRDAGNPTGISPRTGGDIGLLGIELATRRRNRINGTVVAADPGGVQVQIRQAYGNCPKYINRRPWPASLFSGPYTLSSSRGLDPRALTLATSTDTFFIATNSGPAGTDSNTGDSAWGSDISHRGGDPGFLRREGEQLVFDDYPGNNMFNTLGNITRYPPCSILLLDFEKGDFAQLAARGRVGHTGHGRSVFLQIEQTLYRTPDR